MVQVKLIGKQFKGGRQEDAHEFLIHLLDAMQVIVFLDDGDDDDGDDDDHNGGVATFGCGSGYDDDHHS